MALALINLILLGLLCIKKVSFSDLFSILRIISFGLISFDHSNSKGEEIFLDFEIRYPRTKISFLKRRNSL